MRKHEETFAELVSLPFVLLLVASMVPRHHETFPRPSSPFHTQETSSALVYLPQPAQHPGFALVLSACEEMWSCFAC